ncbi:hypothetical protein [Brevibacillus reuszeri]|uniref:hypothetical protein n=1 Tax=Brevibacillus reuszeri TaxID=54915 RepID=UPI00289ED4F0|nr:hypothetical protein [Brevibacillus reuszeri]
MEQLFVILLTGLVIVAFVLIFRNREEAEANLGYKIVGYYLLGAFTFRLNEYALPVGFVVFLLFFRPVKNIKTKQNSAYLGLAFYLLQLIIPAVEEYIYEYPREVAASSSNMYEVPFTHEWTAIRDRIEIDPRAHLEDFHAEYQKDGEIDRLSYKLVSRSAEGFIHYRIEYSPETKAYSIHRKKVGNEWGQFDRTVLATRFFEVLDQAEVKQLSAKNGDEENYLISDGEMTSYAVKKSQKYRIQGNEIKELTNDELPIIGYSITTCGRAEMKTAAESSGSATSHACERQIDYFFDIDPIE